MAERQALYQQWRRWGHQSVAYVAAILFVALISFFAFRHVDQTLGEG